MPRAYVTITDEEGFNTNIIGPFPNQAAADEWVDIQDEKYEGHCQEPFQAFVPISPEEYEGDDEG